MFLEPERQEPQDNYGVVGVTKRKGSGEGSTVPPPIPKLPGPLMPLAGGGIGFAPAGSLDAFPPLERSRLMRLNVVGHRVRLAVMASATAMDEVAKLPEAVLSAKQGEDYLAAAKELARLAGQFDVAMYGEPAATPFAAYQRLLASPGKAMEVSELLQSMAAPLVRMSLAAPVLQQIADTMRRSEPDAPAGNPLWKVLSGEAPATSIKGQPLTPRLADARRGLDTSAAAVLIDSRWLATQAAIMRSEALDPKLAAATRVQRSRARRQEGLNAVTLHYHVNDLISLRELGFLVGAAPHSDADVTAALEAFLQSALAAVAAPDNDAELKGGVGDAWGTWRIRLWHDRLVSLLRIGRR